jgi:putative transposase
MNAPSTEEIIWALREYVERHRDEKWLCLRETCKYKLNPIPEQERALGRVLGVCPSLHNTPLERITAWRRSRVSRFEQEAEVKDIRAEMPEYAAIHSHVLQDLLARLDQTYHAFFRRVTAGARAGFLRHHGRDRWRSFTCKEVSNGADLDDGYLVLSKIGRIAVRWPRPLAWTPRPSRSPVRRTGGSSASPMTRSAARRAAPA